MHPPSVYPREPLQRLPRQSKTVYGYRLSKTLSGRAKPSWRRRPYNKRRIPMHQRTRLQTAVRSLLIAGMAALLTLMNAAHAEAPIRLRIHHFLSPAAPMQAYFEDWKTRVETQSEGRLQVQIFPAMQLGGTAPSLYDQARDGQVDIVWTLTGYTADRFPKSEV